MGARDKLYSHRCCLSLHNGCKYLVKGVSPQIIVTIARNAAKMVTTHSELPEGG